MILSRIPALLLFGSKRVSPNSALSIDLPVLCFFFCLIYLRDLYPASSEPD